MPGSHIPILPPSALIELKPDWVLILPWNIKDEVIKQQSVIKEWGGRFLVSIPGVNGGWYMKRILVTGAAGFLGSHCLNVLQNKNFEIYALDKVKRQNPDTKVNWIETDLREPEQVEQMLYSIKTRLSYISPGKWKLACS